MSLAPHTEEPEVDNTPVEWSLLDSKLYRMNRLYKIVDKNGRVVQFKFNPEQADLFDNLWYMNIILKARQIGFTTFICIYMLDECLFNHDVEAGVVAHTKPDASDIFRRKIQFPYDHLPAEIKKHVTKTTDSNVKIGFSNGSVINVGTGFRSGTLQYLLVSEIGKIAKKTPEKAREIITGTVEAAGGADSLVFFESTAEGKSGQFFDMCERGRKLVESKSKLTRMDYKFHFYAWWKCLDYVLVDEDGEPIPVAINKEMQEYFRDTELAIAKETGEIIKFSEAQKAWYVKKREQLGEDIKREYPSTPDEAFESGLQGTYFKSQFRWLRENGRITKVPHQSGIAVDTWWDLGMDDYLSIWFTQDVGREIHVIDYIEHNNEGLEYYKDRLDSLRIEKDYRYGRIMAPHDIEVRELGSGVSRLETARRLGMDMQVVPRVEKKIDGINKSRQMLKNCWFDQENCDKGVEHLEEYRREWDDVNGVWRDKPLHNEHSHAADSFQTFACGHDFINTSKGARPKARRKKIRVKSAKGWT